MRQQQLLGRGAHATRAPLLHQHAREVHAKPLRAAVVDKPTAAEEPAGPATDAAARCPVLSAFQTLPPPPLSPLDDLVTFFRSIDEHRERTYQGKPMSTGRYMGLLPAVFLYSPDVVKEALVHEAAGTVRAGWPLSSRKLLGKHSSLITTDVVTHKVLRKLMAPALGTEAVEQYLGTIHDICTSTLDRWVAQCVEGRVVKAAPELKTLTLKVITTVVMDMPLSDKDMSEVSRDFNIWIKQWLDPLPHDVWPLPFHGAMRARERLVARIEKRLMALRKEMVEEVSAPGSSTKAKRSILRRLVTEKDEHGNTLTHQQVIDNLLTLLFAGHDTTASQLAKLVEDVALHPEVMDRVRAEQQQVIARHGPHMTPAALKDMKYTSAVLQESFRLTPVVGAVPRKATSDIDLQGYQVTTGMNVVLSLGVMMQHDPRWPADGDPATNPLHPANFYPDRFMTEEGQKQGWQLPFSTGPRTCAGIALAQAEAKIFLATLARGYEHIVDKSTVWKRAPLPRPTNDLPVWITPM